MAKLVFEEETPLALEYQLAGAAYLFNRSENQCRFLFDLCKRNLYKYIELEVAIKRQSIHYCPSSEEEVTRIMRNIKYIV